MIRSDEFGDRIADLRVTSAYPIPAHPTPHHTLKHLTFSHSNETSNPNGLTLSRLSHSVTLKSHLVTLKSHLFTFEADPPPRLPSSLSPSPPVTTLIPTLVATRQSPHSHPPSPNRAPLIAASSNRAPLIAASSPSRSRWFISSPPRSRWFISSLLVFCGVSSFLSQIFKGRVSPAYGSSFFSPTSRPPFFLFLNDWML
ncbi:hypothetical protein PIB30_019691 [Stylosanthes scabra]|uniref:Uncharacterized protein n=1 Tax=Stylosanthes scabra TaxID=79078 RepID=A0ABU6U7A4_9FABA|nr:hypothetical protein [Stylosanthes scabra]